MGCLNKVKYSSRRNEVKRVIAVYMYVLFETALWTMSMVRRLACLYICGWREGSVPLWFETVGTACNRYGDGSIPEWFETVLPELGTRYGDGSVPVWFETVLPGLGTEIGL